MDIERLKNDRNFYWTNHSKFKLRQYGLSPGLIKRIVRQPDRLEKGIAPDTEAAMKRKDTKKIKKEVWVMFQGPKKGAVKIFPEKKKIISAWIYPGVSPAGRDIFIPADVLEELEAMNNIE